MTRQPPTYSYREVQEAREEPEAPPPPQVRVLNRIFTVLTWAILGVVLALWAVVGAVFWIPLMLRAMVRLSVSLLHSVLVGRKPVAAARILRDSMSFYRRGFVTAVEAVTREDIDGEEGGDLRMGKRLFGEILWAAAVWYSILLILGWVRYTPWDLWDWFASIEWNQLGGSLIDRFRG